jgi:pimeloyl-ACP methyl ester carboxylesterase
LGEKKLCIIGSSLGGAIAGVYAARYGDSSLSCAVLLCPAGILSPEFSEFLIKARDDLGNNVEDNLLLPRTAQELNDMMHLVMHHKIKIPSRIALAFVELKQSKAKVHKKGKLCWESLLVTLE